MKSKAAFLLFDTDLCGAHQTVLAAEGELKLASETPAKAVNLSLEWKGDWTHWGRIHDATILNRKQAVRPAIGDLVKLGVGELHTYETNPTSFSWSDGTRPCPSSAGRWRARGPSADPAPRAR